MGEGKATADIRPEVRMCRLVKSTLARQKAMAAEFRGAKEGSESASWASDMRAAITLVVVVGMKGPSSSRGSGTGQGQRARHFSNSMCLTEGREVRLVPPSKRAPHPRGQGRMPIARRVGSMVGLMASYRNVL